jgi:hypothetical protein
MNEACMSLLPACLPPRHLTDGLNKHKNPGQALRDIMLIMVKGCINPGNVERLGPVKKDLVPPGPGNLGSAGRISSFQSCPGSGSGTYIQSVATYGGGGGGVKVSLNRKTMKTMLWIRIRRIRMFWASRIRICHYLNGSVCGSGSGSSHQQAKSKTDVNVPLKSNMQKNFLKTYFLLDS